MQSNGTEVLFTRYLTKKQKKQLKRANKTRSKGEPSQLRNEGSLLELEVPAV